jgi:glutamate dehydrogenase (NADP+)
MLTKSGVGMSAYGPLLERYVEPDRSVQFRVVWEDDSGKTRVNRGWRCQFNNAIGPYKGGLRLAGDRVNLGVLKFLAFEQVLKNSLTGLMIGGSKGGSDFDPRGKSDAEVMRFCQSFMTALYSHIGPDVDVPAGDIGVGAREIGFLFGQYKRLTRTYAAGILTGKGYTFGGSLMRPQATGYGAVYFLMCQAHWRDVLAFATLSSAPDFKEDATSSSLWQVLRGKRCLVSGSGNVALFCVEKLIVVGAKALTLSDSSGVLYEPEGLTMEQWKWVDALKNERRGRLSEYVEQCPHRSPQAVYIDGATAWRLCSRFGLQDIDAAIPCATQNELDGSDAKQLVTAGVKYVAEGANMPCTPEASRVWELNRDQVLFAPAIAVNAGGVAVSALEMAQDSARLQWSHDDVDGRLQGIMANIFFQTVTAAKEYADDPRDLRQGAIVSGFRKVADAMLAQGNY